MTTPKVSRPEPAGYFLEPDAGSGLLDWQHVESEMPGARNYWIASSGADGRPHSMPVWGVWIDRELVFSTGPTTRKARNLRANPWAVVHLESGDRVLVIEGPAREVLGEPELAQFLAVYNPKYAWDFTLEQVAKGGVFAVRAHKVFAWLHSEGEGFAGTATRWLFPD